MVTTISSNTSIIGDASQTNSSTGHGKNSKPKDVEQYLQVIFSVILLLIIIIGNALVMIAYKVNRRLRTGTYTLLASLAFCDFLVGSVSLPMWIYVTLNSWYVDRTFNSFFRGIDYVTAISSSLHLTSICLERWLAISKPFIHQTLTHKQYYITLATVWILSLIIGVPFIIRNLTDIYTLVVVLLVFITPMTIISLVNIYIFKVAKKLIQEEPAENPGTRNERRTKVQRERRTAMTLLIITALFFLSLLPTYTMALIGQFCLRKCFFQNGLKWAEILRLMKVAKWMQYSNSGVNPFIYAFRDAEMRRTFQRISSRAMSLRPFATVANFASQSDINLGNHVSRATTQA